MCFVQFDFALVFTAQSGNVGPFFGGRCPPTLPDVGAKVSLHGGLQGGRRSESLPPCALCTRAKIHQHRHWTRRKGSSCALQDTMDALKDRIWIGLHKELTAHAHAHTIVSFQATRRQCLATRVHGNQGPTFRRSGEIWRLPRVPSALSCTRGVHWRYIPRQC